MARAIWSGSISLRPGERLGEASRDELGARPIFERRLRCGCPRSPGRRRHGLLGQAVCMADAVKQEDRRPGELSRVDYDKVAHRYQEGRRVSDTALGEWWQAVAPFLPRRRPLTVLDLGAGTGIFTRAWPRWCDCRVVAVEPSPGMRSTASLTGIPPQAAMIAAVGEALGLVEASVDVAWLSTVFHHLRDRRACIAELRRVLAPGGVVLVRGLFADRGEVGWLRFFPGAEAARARLPSTVVTAALFAERDFDPTSEVEVGGGVYETARDAARWARRMRDADTLLGAFTDEDFDRGVTALEAAPSSERLANRLALLAFTRR